MIVLIWIIRALLWLLMALAVVVFFNWIAKSVVGVDDWSELSKRKRKEEQSVDGECSFTVHITISRCTDSDK